MKIINTKCPQPQGRRTHHRNALVRYCHWNHEHMPPSSPLSFYKNQATWMLIQIESPDLANTRIHNSASHPENMHIYIYIFMWKVEERKSNNEIVSIYTYTYKYNCINTRCKDELKEPFLGFYETGWSCSGESESELGFLYASIQQVKQPHDLFLPIEGKLRSCWQLQLLQVHDNEESSIQIYDPFPSTDRSSL